MQKTVTCLLIAAVAFVLSGCAVIGTHIKPTENGKRYVTGLLCIDAISDGYPMIPLYSQFEGTK